MAITKPLTTLVMTSALAVSMPAMARDTIQIAGSSTILPFSSIAAEEFGHAFSQYRTPVVGSGGTGGGLRQFCQGLGMNTLDIASASRPIKGSEIQACNERNVKQILEVRLGYDGIVFASRADQAGFALSAEQVFAATAAQVVRDGQPVDNPYTKWSQIDPALPDQDIVLVIPAANHGTREVFEETLLKRGCQSAGVPQTLSADEQAGFCTKVRNDGRVIEVAGDYTETLTRLQVQPEAVGVFGLNFYEQNRDRLQVASIDGVVPSLDSVGDGSYPVSRPLFFYVKGEHLDAVPGLADFVEYFLADSVSGYGSPLEEAGLIPLGDDERAEILDSFKQRKAVR